MADIINLNQMRKQRAKVAAQAQAKENRARFGQTKSEKARAKAEQTRIDRTLDDLKLD